MNNHTIKMERRVLMWATFWFIILPVSIGIFLALMMGQFSPSNSGSFLNIQQNTSMIIILIIGLFFLVLLINRQQLKIRKSTLFLNHTFYKFEIEKSNILNIERCNLSARLKSEIYTKANGVCFNHLWSGYFIGSNHQRYFCAVASDFGVVFHLIDPVNKCTFVAVSVDEAACEELSSWLNGESGTGGAKAQPMPQGTLQS